MKQNKSLIFFIFYCTLFTILFTNAIFAEDKTTVTEQNMDWKNKWYVNTIWYQIFPDRFYNGDKENDPTETETYTKEGELEKLILSNWYDDNPNWKSKYGGDLIGIDQKLDYISDLGISGIWLNPIFKATSNHKYNTADYAKVDPAFGDRKILAKLVKDLHDRNIKIILDGVFNHSGYEFWAFQDIVQKGEESNYKDWYYIKSYPIVKLWEQDKDHPANYSCWWGVNTLPQLNMDNEATRNYIIEVCKGWMKLGIDGWRLDVPNEIKNKLFWKEWSKAISEANPEAYTTGEIWDNPKDWIGENGVFTAVMNYHGFRVPVMLYFTGQKIKLSEFDKMLKERRAEFPHSVNCGLQNLLSSHDTARILSAIKNKDKDDHDKEKANYDKGSASSEDIAKYKTIIAFQMTYVGAPMIYYGDEIGMTGGKDPDCRRPMKWDEKDQNLDILNHYKKLIKIRNENKEFRTGEFKTLYISDKNNVYAYERTEGDESSIVVLNYSDKEHSATIKDVTGNYIDLMTGSKVESKGNKLNVKLSPYGQLVLKKQK